MSKSKNLNFWPKKGSIKCPPCGYLTIFTEKGEFRVPNGLSVMVYDGIPQYKLNGETVKLMSTLESSIQVMSGQSVRFEAIHNGAWSL